MSGQAIKGGPGSGNFGHAGRPGKVGGSASDGEAGAGEHSPTEYPQFKRAEWETKPVPDRIAAWASLSQEERDHQAQPDNVITAQHRERLVFAGQRPAGPARAAVSERLRQIGDFIPSDAAERIDRHTNTLLSFLEEAKTSPEVQHALVMEVVDSLAVQENEALSRQLGDHGTRHILGDMDMSLEIIKQHPSADTAEERAAVVLAAIFHDTGYLTEPAQIFLDNDHSHWSAQHYDTNLRPLVAKAIGPYWARQLTNMIETHASADIDWMRPAEAALRLSDNLALFHKEKLPGLFHYVPANVPVLLRLGKKEITVEDARTQMHNNVDRAPLSAKVKQQLHKAAGEVGGLTPKFTAGMLSGEVSGMRWKGDHLAVTLRRKPNQSSLLRSLDMGQRQFEKFAKDMGEAPALFSSSGYMDLKRKGRTVVTVSILSEKIKAALQAAGLLDMPLAGRWLEFEATIPEQHLRDVKILIDQDAEMPHYDTGTKSLRFDPERSPEPAFAMALGRHVAQGKKETSSAFPALYAAAVGARRMGSPEVWLAAGEKSRDMALKMESTLFGGLVVGARSLTDFPPRGRAPESEEAPLDIGRLSQALVEGAAAELAPWLYDGEDQKARLDTAHVTALTGFVQALGNTTRTPYAVATGIRGDVHDNFEELSLRYFGAKGGSAGEAGVRSVCSAPLADAYLGALDVVLQHMDAQKGGPGSGGFDHAGRPGKVGGSAPSGMTAGEHDKLIAGLRPDLMVKVGGSGQDRVMSVSDARALLHKIKPKEPSPYTIRLADADTPPAAPKPRPSAEAKRVPQYPDPETEQPISKVAGGADVSAEALLSPEWEKGEAKGVHRIYYNAASNTWHMATDSWEESVHDTFTASALDSEKPDYEQRVLVRGLYDADRNRMLLYDLVDQAGAILGSENDPYAVTRLGKVIERATQKAERSVFGVEGKKPDITVRPMRYTARGDMEAIWIREKALTLAEWTKGGFGSGNFGHAGRPGKRGGSAPDGMINHSPVQDDTGETREGFPEANATGGKTRTVNGTKINTATMVNEAISKANIRPSDIEKATADLRYMGHRDPPQDLVAKYAREEAILRQLQRMTKANVTGQMGKWDMSSAQSIHDAFNDYLGRRIQGQHARWTERTKELSETPNGNQ